MVDSIIVRTVRQMPLDLCIFEKTEEMISEMVS